MLIPSSQSRNLIDLARQEGRISSTKSVSCVSRDPSSRGSGLPQQWAGRPCSPRGVPGRGGSTAPGNKPHSPAPGHLAGRLCGAAYNNNHNYCYYYHYWLAPALWRGPASTMIAISIAKQEQGASDKGEPRPPLTALSPDAKQGAYGWRRREGAVAHNC